MKINKTEIDASKLPTKDELFARLREHGESDSGLANIRELYEPLFEDELVWRFPITDGWHMGTFIVPIKEGFISLPYDVIDRNEYEILELDEALLLDVESVESLMDDWRTYSLYLIGAMSSIRRILKSK